MTDQISNRDLTTQLEQGDSHNAAAFFTGKYRETLDLVTGQPEVSADIDGRK
jgi:hypothetical protein